MKFQYLNEYLTPTQRSKYEQYQVDKEARAATDHFFGVGNDMVREDVPDTTSTEKGEVHLAIEKAIGQEISVEDYRKGTVKDRYNRDVKIGRLIRDEKLRNQFASDPARQGTRKSGYYATIHRGIEVAGQTNSKPNETHPQGHSWGGQSCKNVDTGGNRRYLEREIRAGTVVIFVHEPSGKEIYRATLHPFMSKSVISKFDDDDDDYEWKNRHQRLRTQIVDQPQTVTDYAYALDAEYGVKNKNFTAFAKDVARRLTGELTGTDIEFNIHPNVYNDRAPKTMIHPKAPSELFDEYIRKSIASGRLRNYYSKQIVIEMLRSRTLTPSLFKICLTSAELVLEYLVQLPNLTTGQKLEILRAYPQAITKLLPTLPTAVHSTVVQFLLGLPTRPMAAAAARAVLLLGKREDWDKLSWAELQKVVSSPTAKKLSSDCLEYARNRIIREVDLRTMPITDSSLRSVLDRVPITDAMEDALLDNIQRLTTTKKRNDALAKILTVSGLKISFVNKALSRNLTNTSVLDGCITDIVIKRRSSKARTLSDAVVEYVIKHLPQFFKLFYKKTMHYYSWRSNIVANLFDIPEIAAVSSRIRTSVNRVLYLLAVNDTDEDYSNQIISYIALDPTVSSELLGRILSESEMKIALRTKLKIICNPNSPITMKDFLKTIPSTANLVNALSYDLNNIITDLDSANELDQYLVARRPKRRNSVYSYRFISVLQALDYRIRHLTNKK